MRSPISVKRSSVTLFSIFVTILSSCESAVAPQPAGDPLPNSKTYPRIHVGPVCNRSLLGFGMGSIKGYELYTWEDGGRTWFTLLPGTNRNKTPEEVFSVERDSAEPDGWIAITVASLDAVGGQFARLPSGEWVSVFTVRYPAGDELETLDTPEIIARTLHRYADALRLNMQP